MGLTSQEAHKRLEQYGPNDTTGVKQVPGVVQFLRLFLNPLIVILIIASIVSAALGDPVDAGIILLIVLASNTLNFVQTHRSQQAVDKLRASVALTATALRDGACGEIPAKDLVPGDVIRLTAGDLIPADARLVQSTDLQIQQAALTGESQPAEKTADDQDTPTENLAEAHNRVFLGTSVVSGAATALVTATGRGTAFGDIAASLARAAGNRIRARHGRLQLPHGTDGSLPGALRVPGEHSGHHHPLQSLLFAVSLAVGLTPEVPADDRHRHAGEGALHMAKQRSSSSIWSPCRISAAWTSSAATRPAP